MISLLRKFAPTFPKVREITIKSVMMFSTRKLLRISVAMMLPIFSFAQKETPIVLTNPSFEDIQHSVKNGIQLAMDHLLLI